MKLLEEEILDLLLEFFGWDRSLESRFHALLILRRARQEPTPTFDEYRAQKMRS